MRWAGHESDFVMSQLLLFPALGRPVAAVFAVSGNTRGKLTAERWGLTQELPLGVLLLPWGCSPIQGDTKFSGGEQL